MMSIFEIEDEPYLRFQSPTRLNQIIHNVANSITKALHEFVVKSRILYSY